MSENAQREKALSQALEFGIANFKAFGPKFQRMCLRPITLVFGPNGSGKSSLLHSLLWLRDVWESGNPDVHLTGIAGSAVDLGGFRQFRFKGDQKNDVTVGWQAPTRRFGLASDGHIGVQMTYGTKPASANLRRRTLSRDWMSDRIARFRQDCPHVSDAEIVARLIADFQPWDILFSAIHEESGTQKNTFGEERIKRLVDLMCPTVIRVWHLHPELAPELRPQVRENPKAKKGEFPHTKQKHRPWRKEIYYEHSDCDTFDREGRVLKAAQAFVATIKQLGVTLEQIETEFIRFARSVSQFVEIEIPNLAVADPRLVRLSVELDGAPVIGFEIEDNEKLWCRKLDACRLAALLGVNHAEFAGSEIVLGESYCREFFSLAGGATMAAVQFDSASYARAQKFLPKPRPAPLSAESANLVCALATELLAKLHNSEFGDFLPSSYLGPLRAYPDRDFSASKPNLSPWESGGIRAWENLAKDGALRCDVNTWLKAKLKTSYEVVVDQKVSLRRLEELLHKAYQEEIGRVADAFWIPGLAIERLLDRDIYGRVVSVRSDGIKQGSIEYEDEEAFKRALDMDGFWQRMMSFAKAGAAGSDVLRVRDGCTGAEISHRDLGTGFSQVLPVLVQAIAAENQFHLIEQPEIHLHPALQAELGDVFIDSALTRGNRFLLETHSEHLILRVLRRIRETTFGKIEPGQVPVTADDVAVLYVKPGPDGSEIIELPVTPDGDFAVPWPDGFFPERAKELF